MRNYLLPIADREPLSWIISNQQTAFGARRRREADALEPGDRILLYTTRSCFRSPKRDRGRVIGIAHTAGSAHELSQPILFGDREFTLAIRLQIGSLAPCGHGVELAPLVDQLESFPKRDGWAAYLRRSLVPLTPRDGDLLADALTSVADRYERTARTYRELGYRSA